MCIIPRVFRLIGNKGIRLRNINNSKTRRARQLFSLLSYLYIYECPHIHHYLFSSSRYLRPVFTILARKVLLSNSLYSLALNGIAFINVS